MVENLEQSIISTLIAHKDRLVFSLANRQTLHGWLKDQGRYELLVDNGQQEVFLPKREILFIEPEKPEALSLSIGSPHKSASGEKEESNPMDIQSHLLNRAVSHRVPVVVHLITKQRLVGTVAGFDNYTILLLRKGTIHPILVYKHGVTTVHVRTRPSTAKERPRGAVSAEQPA